MSAQSLHLQAKRSVQVMTPVTITEPNLPDFFLSHLGRMKRATAINIQNLVGNETVLRSIMRSHDESSLS